MKTHFMAVKEHIPNKGNTTRLASRTQNICFLTSIFAVILKKMVQITSIFCKRYLYLRNVSLKAFLDLLNGC